MPHAFVGVVEGDESQIAPALHRYIVSVLRGGRVFEPLVTYNTWFSSGADINEESIAAAMSAASAAGAELFELDAGWYEGAGELDAFDFASGLGTWRVDTKKFPHGQRELADRAHGLGMKFGLWVEPERVDLRHVGEPGMARETWLMQENGLYQPGVPNNAIDTVNAASQLVQLDNVPAGVVELRFWHETLKTAPVRVTVKDGQSVNVDVVLAK